jgi:hypothetical protein
VTPAGASLTAAQKASLTAAVHDAVQRFADALGVGETIVYNRLVAAIMAVEGVSDVSLDLFPATALPPAGRRNLVPAPPDTRPRLDVLDVTLRGALIALDVAAVVERRGLAATADPASALADARADIARRLSDLLSTATGVIDKSALRGGLPDTATYHVEDISYTAEFVDEGLRISAPDREIDPGDDQQPWLRTVSVTEKVATT